MTPDQNPRRQSVFAALASPRTLRAALCLSLLPSAAAFGQDCTAAVTNDSGSLWMVAVFAGQIPADLESGNSSELLSVDEIGAGTSATVTYPAGHDLWVQFKRIHIDGRTAYDVEMPGRDGSCAYLVPTVQNARIEVNAPTAGDIRFVD